ncbi:MAG TPA: hypothetical protein ENK23_03565 [Sorangium sp.]|nr:hypothetical protein [Sorangium sp.]
MLPPFIIEQIRQREQQEQRRRDDARPRVELPIERNPHPDRSTADDDDSDRGVIVLDLMG